MSENNYTRDELNILIKKHKGTELEKWYASALYKLDTLVPVEIDIILNETTNCFLTGKQILTFLGFVNNNLYTKELHNILSNIPNIHLLKGRGYTEEIVAFGLVSEILDYYRVRYDESLIISEYDIDINRYLDLKTRLHHWCIVNYWNTRTIIT